MLRKLALSLAIAGVITSSQAHALGLGDIRIKSALNEPLNAEIKLSQVKDLNPLQIRPRMATADEFDLAGVSQPKVLSNVRFQVRVNPNGSGTILLTSNEPVREPFLNFLVEVNWPNGRLVREYTVLLDPPVFDTTPSLQSVTPSVSQAATSRPQFDKTPTKSASSNIRTRMNKATQAYVDVKDTLWELAIRHRVAADISSYQMMMALYKKNPRAFTNGNINNLKAGVVIDIPTEAEARALSTQAAAHEVHQQTVMWKNGGQPTAEPAPIDATNTEVKKEATEVEPVAGEEKGQLKVVASSEATEQQETALSDSTEISSDDEKQQDLIDQLAISHESIDRLERDNVELKETLSTIQEQLESLTRLVELKDEQVATLQAELLKVKEAPKPVPEEKSLLDTIMAAPEYLAGLAGVLVAVFAGLFVFLRKKKSSQDDELELDGNLNGGPQVVLNDDAADQMAELDAVADELATADDENILNDLESDADDLNEDAHDNLDAELDSLSDLEDLDLDMDLDLDESLDSDLDALSLDDLPEDQVVELDADEESLLNDILDQPDDIDETLQDDEFDLGLDDIDDALADAPQKESVATADSAPRQEVDNALDDLLNDSSDDEELDALLELDAEDELEKAAFDKVAPLADIDDDSETLASLGISEQLDATVLDELVDNEPAAADIDNLDGLDDLGGLDDLDDLISNDLDTLETDPLADETVADASLDNELDALFESNETLEPLATPADRDEVAGDLDFDLESLNAEIEGDLASLDQNDDVSSDSDDLDFNLEELDLSETDNADRSLDLEGDSALEFDTSADLHPEVSSLLSDPIDLDDSLEEELAPLNELDTAGVELDAEELLPNTPSDEEVTEELTSNIEHDLDSKLDSELEALLSSTDNDIALEETGSEEVSDPVSAVSFLDNADEVETKLDLARAYIDMDDLEGAREILNEIVAEGSDTQKAEANSLLEGLS